MDGVSWAEWNASVKKELNHIGYQAALGHGEQIVQWFQSLLPFVWR